MSAGLFSRQTYKHFCKGLDFQRPRVGFSAGKRRAAHLRPRDWALEGFLQMFLTSQGCGKQVHRYGTQQEQMHFNIEYCPFWNWATVECEYAKPSEAKRRL